jgi:tetraprenyl-beta-curcumene synthase
MRSNHDISAGPRLRAFAAFPWAMLTYWLTIFPTAGRELNGWRRQACAIPDPVLRRHAVAKIDNEHLTAEGAAAFAILVPRGRRRQLVRACVAFEVMYDYLDALTEEHATLENNRSLHRALRAAVDIRTPVPGDLYDHHPQQQDGGYLRQLAEASRRELAAMPREAVVAAALVRATERAAEVQSLNHATTRTSLTALRRWAEGQRHDGLEWWEAAAAAGAPMVIFGLIAAACDERTTATSARIVETAYHPWVSALEWLLEGLADEQADRATGMHSYISHYRTEADVARRLSTLAGEAVSRLSRLRAAERHLLLVAGMAGMLLSGEDQPTRLRAARAALRNPLGGLTNVFVLMLRARRRAKRLRGRIMRRGPNAAG